MKTLQELKEIHANSTKVNGWYAYRNEDGNGATVRGPFHRWLRVDPGDDQSDQFPQNKGIIANDFDDAKYAAEAMNALPALIEEVELLREAFIKVIIPTGATVSKEELQISSYALRTLAQSKGRMP